jgi:hypothetical protein
MSADLPADLRSAFDVLDAIFRKNEIPDGPEVEYQTSDLIEAIEAGGGRHASVLLHHLVKAGVFTQSLLGCLRITRRRWCDFAATQRVARPVLVCRVAVHDGRITLDAKEIVLNVTTDARQDLLRFFRALTAKPCGEWVSGNDISGGILLRWERKLKAVPRRLFDLVESKGGTGYRLRTAAWRE